MRGLPNGTFLIRKAGTAPTGGNLSLSIRDGDSVRHYRIRKLNNGGYFIEEGAPFSNLIDLVAHYMEESDGLICKLTMACPGTSYALRVFFIHEDHATLLTPLLVMLTFPVSKKDPNLILLFAKYCLLF